jgi:hypothetical protein
MRVKILTGVLVLLFMVSLGCQKSYHPTLNPDWADITLRAKGMGAPPSNAENAAQAKLLARNAAKMDALRNLQEQIYGIQIESQTYVRDYITRSDEIRARTEGFIKKARIISEKENADGSYEVTVELFLGKKFADIIMN